ncbi:MAG: hypothetical protein HY694_13655 [Deltaproteobacteria bacterium]|nr:hypothetical protein [Deltaproteobacteria bacterium]
MGRYYLKDQSLARAKKVSVGIDVPKESWQVAAISEGEELFSGGGFPGQNATSPKSV